MIHIAIIAAVFLSALVESWRIKAVKGRWVNVPKWVTNSIGAALFGVILFVFNKIDFQREWPFILLKTEWYYIIPDMFFLRAALYDPFLNELRGLKWDYISISTNSWLDRIEANFKAYIKRRFKIELHFIAERVFYWLLALIFLILYEWF